MRQRSIRCVNGWKMPVGPESESIFHDAGDENNGSGPLLEGRFHCFRRMLHHSGLRCHLRVYRDAAKIWTLNLMLVVFLAL